jgi:hypothetical protein
MYDFTHIIDFIFKNKDNYKKLSDEDKERCFFMVNRKLARGFPTHAQFFNDKSIDKANATDIWYHFFIKKGAKGIPSWYWPPKKEAKEKSIATKADIEFLMNLYDIKENDVQFLIQYHKEDVIEELKKYHKFEK